MTYLKVPGFYILRHRPSGRFYIGSTFSIQHRLYRHRAALKGGFHGNHPLQEVYTKWEDFDIQVTYVDTVAIAKEYEQELIDAWHGTEGCCNLSNSAYHSFGGLPTGWRQAREALLGRHGKHRLGATHTEEAREKIRQAQLGNKNTLGYKHTEQAKERIRAACSARVKRVSIAGVEYPSVYAAAQALDILHATVRWRIVSGGHKYEDWKYLAAL